MWRYWLKLFSVVAAVVFIWNFDRFGEQMFVNFIFLAFAPSIVEVQNVPTAIIKVDQFPRNFSFGVSTSAFQVEGGWNEDGKTPSVWDTFTHEHSDLIADGSNADVTTDSYHLYKKDVDALNQVGFQHYRLSLSWTRIITKGLSVNQKGIDYYDKIIDELIANNIEPVVTLFHWDLPQWLQDFGGATNPIFADYFKDYADVVFNAFGHKVKRWITINEIYNYCIMSYGLGKGAPGIKSPGVGDYLCGHHLLMAHAAAYHLYREKYFKKFGGEVGITMESTMYIRKDSTVSLKEHQRALQYRLGWFAKPIFSSDGGYPQVMIDEIDNRSAIEGRPFSRLPKMSNELMKSIRGSSDFFGLNYYTSAYLQVNKVERDPLDEPSWFKDSGVVESVDPQWKQSKTFWLYSVPEGFRDLLNWIKKEYNNPAVFITENGWSDEGQMEDNDRIEYLNSHLSVISKAINEDACNVIGYTAWSLMDSFEWSSGYTLKYGFFSVNFTSPGIERIPKKSAGYLKNVIKNRALKV